MKHTIETTFFHEIDFARLNKQKDDLLKIAYDSDITLKQREAVKDIWEFLDLVQDYCVDVLQIPEQEVNNYIERPTFMNH